MWLRLQIAAAAMYFQQQQFLQGSLPSSGTPVPTAGGSYPLKEGTGGSDPLQQAQQAQQAQQIAQAAQQAQQAQQQLQAQGAQGQQQPQMPGFGGAMPFKSPAFLSKNAAADTSCGAARAGLVRLA